MFHPQSHEFKTCPKGANGLYPSDLLRMGSGKVETKRIGQSERTPKSFSRRSGFRHRLVRQEGRRTSRTDRSGIFQNPGAFRVEILQMNVLDPLCSCANLGPFIVS